MSASDAERAVAELAASQHGVLTRRQAAARSFGPRRVATAVRNGWLSEPVSGVLVVCGARDTWARRLTVATLAGGGSVASHRSAARLHRLDGFRDDVVEVTVASGRYHEVPGVVLHRTSRWAPQDTTSVAGVEVTSLPRTLADLGAVVDDDRLEQAVDDALRRGLDLPALLATLDRLDRPGPSGTARLRRVLDRPDRAGRLPDSWFERLVGRLSTGAVVPLPERQHVVRDGAGRVLGRLDLAWPEAMLGLEAHSERWHHGPRRGRRDLSRDNALAAVGWELLYATWSDVERPDRLVAQLGEAYRRRVVQSRRVG